MVIDNILVLLMRSAAARVSAATVGVGGLPGVAAGSNVTYWQYVGAIYQYSLIIGITLSGLVIAYAGILYMISQGESSKIQSAKDYFVGAIIGLTILLLMGAILQFIGLPKVDGTI
ncbi:MAG: hypothetical protein WCG48_02835 [Candidatus Berkelbacteria bacterium]